MVITKKYFTDFEDNMLQLSVNKEDDGNIRITVDGGEYNSSMIDISPSDVKELINELNNLISNG